MAWSAIQTFIAFAGFLLTGLVLAMGGVWKLAKMEGRLIEAITTHRRELDEAIATARQNTMDAVDRSKRDAAELIMAMQTKINQFEIWTRDTFVRRESFLIVINETKATWQQATEKIDKRLDKIDEKLDELRSNPPAQPK